MDTAGDLTGCEQARNWLMVFVQHMSLGVNDQTAHSVVDARGNLDGIVGALAQVVVHGGGTAKVRVILGGYIAVPVRQSLGQHGAVHAQLLAQRINGGRFLHDAGLDVLLGSLQTLPQALIEDDVGVAALLLEFRCGDLVSGQHFVDEAQALLVDQNCAVSADTLGNQHGGALLYSGMELNLVQIPRGSAYRGGHDDAVAGGTGGIGGHRTGQAGFILGDHVHIRTVAAGGQHHGLGTDGIHGVGALRLNAHGLAVLHDDGGGPGIVHDGNLHVVQYLQEGSDQVRAHAVAVSRGVDAGYGSAAGESQLGQRRTDGIQPVDGAGGGSGQGRDQGGIVDALAADHGIQSHELRGVEIALGVCLVGIPLLLNRFGQGGDGLVAGPLFLGGGKGVFHALGVGEFNLGLIFGAGSVHAAGGLGGVAAGIGHLLHNEHIFTGVGGVDGGGHARTACAYHHHIGLNGLLSLVGSGDFRRFGCGQLAQVRACCIEGLVGGVQNGVAGDSGAADGVHLSGLVLQNGLLQQGHGEGADVFRFAAAVNNHICNLVVGDSQCYGAVAAEASGGFFIGAGNEQRTLGGGIGSGNLLAGGGGQGLGYGIADAGGG